MRDLENIRTKEHLNYLKKEFNEHVIEVNDAIRNIEKRSIIRNEQMNALDNKLDSVIDALSDSKLSTKKGVITQTLENTDKLNRIQTEMAAWKRASIIVGGLLGFVTLGFRYLYVVIKQIIINETN
jgi:hypothetical protein